MKNLIIVESPAKAKTIEKFLGKDYKVMSSYGHIRDLAKKGLGIEDTTDFEPIYEIPFEKKDLVRKLKAAAKDADMVWLASDEDREGEAIAWHLFEVLGLKAENTKRIVFHEITKPAILASIENPRDIDIDRVNAQQARRLLDRIVGFELSPVLWKKIKPALSAGRVQSVAVRLICEREKEIENFVAQPFYRVNAILTKETGDSQVKAEYGKRLETEAEARKLLEYCNGKTFTISDITVRPVKRSPLPPFTTSTLQQEAHRRLGYSVNQTMVLAQKLYEEGHITYMRTDSMNLSNLALKDIAETVTKDFGEGYLHQRRYHTHSKGAQEAHEAIRPTYVSKRKIDTGEREQRLYDLIWRRTVASQMEDAVLEKTTIDMIPTGSESALLPEASTFKAEGEMVKFEGFMKVYAEQRKDKDALLPPVEKGEELNVEELTATERFTQPPTRYNEGSLVKKMEDLGIGRPATYASTISTIQSRGYVERGEKEGKERNYIQLILSGGKIERKELKERTGSDKGKLVPTDVGMIVNDFLTGHFPDILDYNFTARIEEKFDDIAQGQLKWKDEISDFYGGFHPNIENINSLRMEHKVGERKLGIDPKTGRPVLVKIGRFGPVVQIGEATDSEKPLFASLATGQSISTITLEEALKLFELPREIGEYEGVKLTAAVGRFGPYVKFGSSFVSIPKGLAPQTITLEEAIELIEAKKKKESDSLIKEFSEMPGLKVVNGRYGPYLTYKEGKKKAANFRLPKGTDPQALTFEEAKDIMEKQGKKKSKS